MAEPTDVPTRWREVDLSESPAARERQRSPRPMDPALGGPGRRTGRRRRRLPVVAAPAAPRPDRGVAGRASRRRPGPGRAGPRNGGPRLTPVGRRPRRSRLRPCRMSRRRNPPFAGGRSTRRCPGRQPVSPRSAARPGRQPFAAQTPDARPGRPAARRAPRPPRRRRLRGCHGQPGRRRHCPADAVRRVAGRSRGRDGRRRDVGIRLLSGSRFGRRGRRRRRRDPRPRDHGAGTGRLRPWPRRPLGVALAARPGRRRGSTGRPAISPWSRPAATRPAPAAAGPTTYPAWLLDVEYRQRLWDGDEFRNDPAAYHLVEALLLRAERDWLQGADEDATAKDLKADPGGQRLAAACPAELAALGMPCSRAQSGSENGGIAADGLRPRTARAVGRRPRGDCGPGRLARSPRGDEGQGPLRRGFRRV